MIAEIPLKESSGVPRSCSPPSAPRMRTATEAVAELKAVDPGTALTVRAVRRMIATGEIPHVDVGTKKLVDMRNLFAYLSAGNQSGRAQNTAGNIRRIAR